MDSPKAGSSKDPLARQVEAHERLVDQLTASADGQEASLFFTKLPLEIRKMVYVEFWRTSGLRQHITYKPSTERRQGYYTRSPCLNERGAPDIRYSSYQSCQGEDSSAWQRRLRSDWTTHWRCQELLEDNPETWSPFFPVLLTCKRFYLEGIDSIFESLTFCLTDTMAANKFLTRWPAPKIHSLDISLLLTASLTDFYLRPGQDKAIIVGKSTVNANNNVWEQLCRRLASLPQLRDVHIWLDSKDLRSWHKCVAETRFLARLYDIQVGAFRLCLPRIPDDPEARGLPGCYLEDEERDAPFILERGERPNNWEVYLSTRAGHMPNRLHQEVPMINSRDWFPMR